MDDKEVKTLAFRITAGERGLVQVSAAIETGQDPTLPKVFRLEGEHH